jgi:hypothetical protein
MTTDPEEEKEKRIVVLRGAKSEFERTTLKVGSSTGLSEVKRTVWSDKTLANILLNYPDLTFQRHAEQLCTSIPVHILCSRSPCSVCESTTSLNIADDLADQLFRSLLFPSKYNRQRPSSSSKVMLPTVVTRFARARSRFLEVSNSNISNGDQRLSWFPDRPAH